MNNPVIQPWYEQHGAMSLLSIVHPSDLQIIEVTPVIGHKYFTWMLLSESLEEGLHLIRSCAVDKKAGCTFRSDINAWLKVEKDVPTVVDALCNLWGDPQGVVNRFQWGAERLNQSFQADPVGFATLGVRNQSSNIFTWYTIVNTLVVLFTNGRTYKYKDVPAHVIGSLEAAESKGEFIAQHIVKGGYDWVQVETDQLPDRDAMIKRGFEMAEAFRVTHHTMTADTLLHFSHKLRDSGYPVAPLKRYFNECAERLEVLTQRRG